MRSIIIANGNLKQLPDFTSDDLIIAADGGARHCFKWGITPHYVIGDMDSLNQLELQNLDEAGAVLISYPADKDYTDLELSISFAIQKDCQEIVIYGALGERWDQTFANLLLPIKDNFLNKQITLIDGQQEVKYIRPGETFYPQGQPGDTLSLIPLQGKATGVTTNGLAYPLVDESLSFGSTRGISNIITEQGASVYVTNGILACIVIHNSPVSGVEGTA